MRKRACVFIDGENLRHSLISALAPDGVFRASDYLPSKARWADFYDWIVWLATSGTHDRLRAYWFVIQLVKEMAGLLEQLKDRQGRGEAQEAHPSPLVHGVDSPMAI